MFLKFKYKCYIWSLRRNQRRSWSPLLDYRHFPSTLNVPGFSISVKCVQFVSYICLWSHSRYPASPPGRRVSTASFLLTSCRTPVCALPKLKYKCEYAFALCIIRLFEQNDNPCSSVPEQFGWFSVFRFH